LLETSRPDLPRVAVLEADLPRCLAMELVVRVHGVDGGDGFTERGEGQDTLSGRKPPFEPRGLHDDGPTGRQVVRAPFAEPAAVRRHVSILRHAPLAARSGDVVPIRLQGPARAHPVPDVPPGSSQPVLLDRWVSVHGELERLARPFGKTPE